jgi:hypothetical protein
MVLNQTRIPILALILAVAFAMLPLFMISLVRAQSTDPPVAVAFSKNCVTDGDVVFCQLRVSNTSALIPPEDDSDTAEEQVVTGLSVRDFFPSSGTWALYSAINYSGDDQGTGFIDNCTTDDVGILCDVPLVRGQHLNEAGTAFVTGYADIVVYGQLAGCGIVENNAIMFGLTFPAIADDTAGTACPTPVPPTATPTQIPPTATPTATAIAPTSTPIVGVTPVAPPTTRPPAPLPPNTGSSMNADSEGYAHTGYLVVVLISASVGLAATAVLYRRSR